MSKSTAKEYHFRLQQFARFTSKQYNTTVDNLVNQIREGSQVPYDVLSGFISYLQNNNNISSLTLKQWVVTAKNFLEYHDIDISPRRFKLKVKLPKVVKKEKEAINSCSDIRLKTYVMLLAASGLRALEALSIRVCDVNFDTDPVKVFIRGEYTKTRLDRFVYLTDETAKQLKTWLQYKYRTRRICHADKAKHTTVTEYRTPTKNNTDLIFSVYQSDVQNLKFIYNDLSINFGKKIFCH